ncbi:hypothetical protein [Clostridium sp.]
MARRTRRCSLEFIFSLFLYLISSILLLVAFLVSFYYNVNWTHGSAK